MRLTCKEPGSAAAIFLLAATAIAFTPCLVEALIPFKSLKASGHLNEDV